MIHLTLNPPSSKAQSLELPLSKSILNRELILVALSGGNLAFDDSLWPLDAQLLLKALASNANRKDLGHAGTAMRFSLAYFSVQTAQVILTGSERMKQRPIGILGTALRTLGSSIDYLEEDGFPPIRLEGKSNLGGSVHISGEVSSQYISALLLCGASMKKGLKLHIDGILTSAPYVALTCDILSKWGVHVDQSDSTFHIANQPLAHRELSLELDWSAAAFIYGLVAQGYPRSVLLKHMTLGSMQGDRRVKDYFESLGVRSVETEHGIELHQIEATVSHFEADLKDEPDLAQAIAFTCAALGISCRLKGLHTLRIKETDRIGATQECLTQVGLEVETGKDYLAFSGKVRRESHHCFQTYQDHRMAMSLSILLPTLGEMKLEDEDVVKKSFPQYWEALGTLGVCDFTKT